MLSRQKSPNQLGFYSTFEEQLNNKHPLYILANEVDWQLFEDKFSPLFDAKTGRPAKPIRRMVALLILKHLRNLSDESVVEQWSENSYYQYFGGEKYFATTQPCDASELVHFCYRIGEDRIELILKESIRVNGKDGQDNHVSVDTTVQEKNITFPTDAKLHKKIIQKCKKIADNEQLPVRQSYKFVLKKLSINQRFRNHPRNKAKAFRADKKVKTIAGRLVRELERNLAPNSPFQNQIDLFKRVLAQQKNDSNKIYSLHKTDVQCISKGKEHKKYEFGNKVSIVHTQNTGVLVGALSLRNEYDGHTLQKVLEQTNRMTGKSPTVAVADRGYRGVATVGETKINIPKPFAKSLTRYQKNKMKKQFARRAAIEPVIGHLKTDNRLSRNFYKGIFGDNINVMLSASAFNFKRMMNKWKSAFLCWFENLTVFIQHMFYCPGLHTGSPKMSF